MLFTHEILDALPHLAHAPMESFFGTLKTELVHHREYPDRDTARRDLFTYIGDLFIYIEGY